MTSLVVHLSDIVGAVHVSTDADVLATRSVDWTGRYRGEARALVRPGDSEQVGEVLRACRDAGAAVTVQGGRTSLVAGTVPEHRDVLLSTERLTGMGELDAVERRIRVQAGVTLARVQEVAAGAGLLFGVDLTARDTATIGGMASTNAGGLRTVRYGSMGAQVLGLEVVLPNGSVVQRYSRVRSDNTGYDLDALFVGAEGTLGVITGIDLRLHAQPAHRVAAVCGFTDLDTCVSAGRRLCALESIAALELIDGRAADVAAEHFGVAAPASGTWLLLVEVAGAQDLTERLAGALEDAGVRDTVAVGADASTRQRLWQLRESMAEVVGVYGAPVKFDVSLPLSEIARFEADATALIARHAPEALPLLFGHVGEGNLHLNVLRCDAECEARMYPEMMELIAGHGGNVSSEHGVGTLKRAYLTMSRRPADIAVMRTIKEALDPTGYLNPAVLFD